MKENAFDNSRYVKIQAEHILERIEKFNNKLYLEFGGKLFDDYHASRVLPGFAPDAKVQMFSKLKDKTEFIITVNALDIQSNKIRNDNRSSYESEVLRLIKIFKSYGIKKGSICVSRYIDCQAISAFITRITNMGYPVYKSYEIQSYPYDMDIIFGPDGFERNEFVQTEKPLVIVTAPGPGSGKMATCMSQLYHEYKQGVKAGYAKYETFPVWNLPLKHPVNLAYEAATADLNDVNMIDSFHLEAYGVQTVNYNRDLEVFPVVKTLFEKIYGECPYKSPTDMGVNMAGFCINDEEKCVEACKQEVVRRYLEALVNYKTGKFKSSAIDKITVIMNTLGIDKNIRKCLEAAQRNEEKTGKTSFAIELPNGHIVTGKESKLLTAPAACIINALKYLADVEHDYVLIPEKFLLPIQDLYQKVNLYEKNHRLNVIDVLMVISVTAERSRKTRLVYEQLVNLRGAQGHSTKIMDYNDEVFLKKIGVDVTASDVM